ncbi:MAG: hypothetical protein ACKO01_08915 [Erythrobacter sp.]
MAALGLAAVLLAGLAAGGFGPGPARGPERLPPPQPPLSASPAKPERPRVPIDLGPDAPAAEPPQSIDILVAPPPSEAASAAIIKECDEAKEAGVVSGEIVVCRKFEEDTSQMFSGSREAWLKAYAERTQNAGTLPPPDVAGPGIFRGPATISGLCFIGPCPKDPALIVDVKAMETPPAGSDAERVAQGLAPKEADDAPLDAEAKRRIAAQLGLPEAPESSADPKPRSP